LDVEKKEGIQNLTPCWYS